MTSPPAASTMDRASPARKAAAGKKSYVAESSSEDEAFSEDEDESEVRFLLLSRELVVSLSRAFSHFRSTGVRVRGPVCGGGGARGGPEEDAEEAEDVRRERKGQTGAREFNSQEVPQLPTIWAPGEDLHTAGGCVQQAIRRCF